jgi:hypothetical protein
MCHQIGYNAFVGSHFSDKRNEVDMDMSVRFLLTPSDKEKLDAIAAKDGNAPISATLRRLIRDEALRLDLGLAVTTEAGKVLARQQQAETTLQSDSDR